MTIRTSASPVDAFLERAEALYPARTKDADHQRYETLKRALVAEFPELEPSEYDRAIARIARMTGV